MAILRHKYTHIWRKIAAMETSQKAAIIDAMEAAFAQQGVTDIYTGAARLLSLVEKASVHIAATQSRKKLEAHLASIDAMQEEEFNVLLSFFLTVPQIMQQFLTNAMLQTADSLPRPTGPPVRTTPEQKREIIHYIERLYGKGVRVGDAQRQAAQHFGHSLRSVQRIWQMRKELAQQPFLSIEDVWKFIA